MILICIVLDGFVYGNHLTWFLKVCCMAKGAANFVGFAVMWVWLVGLCNVNVLFVVVG